VCELKGFKNPESVINVNRLCGKPTERALPPFLATLKRVGGTTDRPGGIWPSCLSGTPWERRYILYTPPHQTGRGPLGRAG